MIKKILLGLVLLITALALAAIAFLFWSGAWGALFPSDEHETTPPDLPAELQQPAILLFTKTNGFRHVEGIEAGVKLFERLADEHGWGLYHTENGAVFNDAQLSKFSAVVYHNATGNLLNHEQRHAFKTWLINGGGWLGTHAAGDGSHQDWPWYMDNLIGADFTAHIMGPQFQEATVTIEQPEHPAVHGLPKQFSHTEEWYSWASSPRAKGFNILATIDEDSYEPYQKMFGNTRDLRMGDHPIVWTNCIGKGRSIYSTMGHAADAYDAPEHQRLLTDALAWAMGELGDCKR